MDKDEKLIMVIPRFVLFQGSTFQGFSSHDRIDYESRILSNIKYIKRGIAEEDPTYKQLIPYTIVFNPNLKKVFAYQRSSKDKNYGEKRLQGKWSWGLGGHIEKADSVDGNPIYNTMLRELKEEVEVDDLSRPKVLGYINDDKDDVGKVHFGILYMVETNSEIIKPKDSEVGRGGLKSIKELEDIIDSPDCTVEGWSKIALDPLRDYL